MQSEPDEPEVVHSEEQQLPPVAAEQKLDEETGDVTIYDVEFTDDSGAVTGWIAAESHCHINCLEVR